MSDAPPDSPGSEKGAVSGRRSRTNLVLGVTACAALLGLAIGSLSSSAEFAVEASLEYEVATPPGTAAERESAWNEVLATEAVILRSHSTCSQALAGIGAGRLRTTPESSLDMALRVCESLQVRRVAGTSVLRLHYDDADAGRGTMLLDALVAAYVQRRSIKPDDSPLPSRRPQAEIELHAEDLAQTEQSIHAYAAEHHLLTYDSQSAVASLLPLREELTRKHIQFSELQAQVAQVEAALQGKTYQAVRLADDPEIQAVRVRISTLQREQAASSSSAVDGGAPSDVEVQRKLLEAELEGLALARLSALRAELSLIREDTRRLEALLGEEEQTIAAREFDALELRRRQRALAVQQALYETSLRAGVPAATRSWSVHTLDRAHVAGRSVPAWSWLLALVALVVCVGFGVWRVRPVLPRGA